MREMRREEVLKKEERKGHNFYYLCYGLGSLHKFFYFASGHQNFQRSALPLQFFQPLLPLCSAATQLIGFISVKAKPNMVSG